MAKKLSERVAVCETEITHLKDAMKKVCENELPHIYGKLDSISIFLSDLKPVLKTVEDNTEAIKNTTGNIQNQEKLGRKEKLAIALAVISSLTSIALALFGHVPI